MKDIKNYLQNKGRPKSKSKVNHTKFMYFPAQ